MQLTRFTDFGLRVLMYLTQPERIEPVTNAEIAAQFAIPNNHVVKVVNRLGKLGWVTTRRGRGGGISLGVVADQLRLGDVLRGLEESEQLIDCAKPPCALRGGCRLKQALDDGLASFYATMNRHTLADVSGQRTAAALAAMHRSYLSVLRS